ncbi:GNAT family N-acetyltransferase [Paucisalibacillus globulus]|uniref:GNAT family N-acetyltransferase n=1 Tax=Paucisalibacillus globulus TaxID=351095 RepID=UPI00040BE97E|nr:GNAT family N-acetyltransferase [Paucisalibacillus globulus]
MQFEIRNFKKEDMPLLGDFYQAVTRDRKVVFWWVGPEQNWDNVFCAFEKGRMVAKGQVEIINSISDGHPEESRHSIYLNLKTLPDRELDFDLLNRLYESLYGRALELKQQLSANYRTNLCVGNFGTEVNNNRYFLEEKGFRQLETLYTMERDLHQPINPVVLPHSKLKSDFWKMDSLEEEKLYLEAECEIWPDSALGLKRLREYKSNSSWTAIPVWENGSIVACALVWQEDEIGVIEDVFVKKAWRKQGIAKFLLTTALIYLKDVGLDKAQLMVDTENEKALSVYQSVGFNVVEEERRFCVELV